MAQTNLLNNEPIQFTDLTGRDFIVFDEMHSHSDILNYIINDIGFEHTKAILHSIELDAKEKGLYDDHA